MKMSASFNQSRMTKLLGISILLGTLVILSSAKDSPRYISQAVIPKRDVSAHIGHPVSISCLSQNELPLQSCRWERRPPNEGNRYFVNIKQSRGHPPSAFVDQSSSYNCNCSYEYAGIGLDKGDCSMTIRNVNEFHRSKWECLLSGKNGDSWIGSMHVAEERFDAIHKPYFEQQQLQHEIIYNETLVTLANVTCCVDHPDPNLHFSIYTKNATDVSSLFRTSQNDTLFLRPYRACRETAFQFLPEHNNQLLICNATHYEGVDRHESSVSLPLTVKFGPIVKGDYFSQSLTNSSSLEVNITFDANPIPTMNWYLYTDGEKDNSFEILPNHVKYAMSLSHLYDDKYTASLEILNFEKADYHREFKLTLRNPFGSKEIDVGIAHDTHDTHEDELADANETNWLLFLLIGLGAVILFIFIFTVIWVVVRNNRGRQGIYTMTPSADTQAPESEVEMETGL